MLGFVFAIGVLYFARPTPHSLALGVAVGCRSDAVAALVLLYMGATLAAAIRTEEAFLRERFGDAYDAYADARAPHVERAFSVERVWRNKEYRAVVGLALFLGVLALKMLLAPLN